MAHERLLILDYGSQYTQLIARRARELGVLAEIRRFDVTTDDVRHINPKAIILSGGPASVFDDDAPDLNQAILSLNIPILGVCYGMQLLVQHLGGTVRRSATREYGVAQLKVGTPGRIVEGLPPISQVWASHGDDLEALPDGFQLIGTTDSGVLAVAEDVNRGLYMILFHPEVVQTEYGSVILKNFLFTISGFTGDWRMDSVANELLSRIKQQVGTKKVICALSGGVDSSVVAALLHRAIPHQVHSIFIDHGLLRLREAEHVAESMKAVIGNELVVVDAREKFLLTLKDVTDPEAKRKIIGRLFIETFEHQATILGGADFLAQGTLYPDVIESSAVGAASVTIKSHHNVGGLPDRMKMKLVEPLRELFKDEVRVLGRLLGLPAAIVERHPFPGPGLAVRILGPVTEAALVTLAQADNIFIDELKQSGWYDKTWQAFAVLLPIRTVGVMGDDRTYDQVIALRAVNSTDGMTADWALLPDDLLARVSSRITNEVQGVSRVVYDISSKPPATIEWE